MPGKCEAKVRLPCWGCVATRGGWEKEEGERVGVGEGRKKGGEKGGGGV